MTGSYSRWPLFRETAAALADHCKREAMRCERVLEKIDIKRSRALRFMGDEAHALAECFAAWEFQDPGDILRHSAIAALLDLRGRAQEAGIDIVAAFERA